MFHYSLRLLFGVLIGSAATTAFAQSTPSDDKKEEEKKEDVVLMEKFVAGGKGFDAIGIMPNKPSNLAFGFDKALVDTPRAITLVSSQQIESLGLHNTEDLVKAAPSTYTTFRFGLQGNLSIRNQTSDFYFRGMRRIDPQGNFSTRWGANDSLEIVRGPASPIFGLGRIGGYVNFNPKTARAETGKYLEKAESTAKLTYGSFDKKVFSLETSGPLDVAGKQAGYSVYGYVESGGSYRVNNRINQQQLLQATVSINLTKNVRMEMGTVLQSSYGGLDGGNNRTTPETIPMKTYWSGTSGKSPFSFQVDGDGDGYISEKEYRDAYFWGTPQLSVTTNDPRRNSTTRQQIGPSLIYFPTTNDSFYRTVPWQGGPVNGGTITVDQFKAGYLDTVGPAVVGKAPIQRVGYQLMVYPLNSQGLPDKTKAKVPFWLPPTFDLDPNYTWVRKPVNKKMSLGEDFYRANVSAYFMDFINDYNPNQTYKNQIFIDGHHQIKQGSNGYTQRQHPLTVEDKFTFTKKMEPTRWWSANFLGSANMFMTWVQRTGAVSYDIDWRRDLQRVDSNDYWSTFTSNDRFYSYSATPGTYEYQPPTSSSQSFYKVIGTGLLLDQTFFKKLNFISGFRYDYIDARYSVPAGLYARGSSESIYSQTGLADPNAYYSKGNSSKPSMSASLSYTALGLHPYVSVGKQALIINSGSDGGLNTTQATRSNLTGFSTLIEAGLKGSYFKNRIFFGLSAYDQTRSSYDILAGGGAGAVSSTVARGYEMEMRLLLTKNLSLTVNGNWSKSELLQSPGVVNISAREAGYPDVVDANGNIVIPAEAFGWGGRLQTSVPAASSEYNEIPGQPNHVISSTMSYNFTSGKLKGFFMSATALDQGSYALGVLRVVKVPEVWVFDASVGYRQKTWEAYIIVNNVLNRDAYASGIGSATVWVRPSFPQAVELNIVRKF
jgi:iron complex outermembrane receptor protein